MSVKSSAAAILLGIASVAATGYSDYATGPEAAFSLFYLIPIVLVAWYAGAGPAVVVAMSAGAAWLAADLPMRPTSNAAIAVWNGATRLVIFSAFAWLVARVRADRVRLSRLLDQETRLARTDPLTGLSNARAFQESFAAEVARSHRHGTPLAVAFVDLDNFKMVNDSFGHEEGDRVLRAVADALRDHVRTGDVTARLGGDEFVIAGRIDDPEEASAMAARLVAAVRAIGASVPGAGLGASVGIVHCAVAPAEPRDLLHLADEAMYEAKRGEKCTVVVYRRDVAEADPARIA